AAHGGWDAAVLDGVLRLAVMLFCPRGIFLTIGERLTSAFAREIQIRDQRVAAEAPPARSLAEVAQVSAPARGESGALLEVRSISQSFGGITAISDVSLRGREGDVRCVIGAD